MAHEIHPHHSAALRWASESQAAGRLFLCRFTQLGLLRLLTNISAMGPEALTLEQAWSGYDRFAEFWRMEMLEELTGLDVVFRRRTHIASISTKLWADGYLAAFAETANLTLVTFDKALAARAKGAVLLPTI